MGKVIDVEFRPSDRGRWCTRCDEPFPEGTAMCPRCGGELLSAARHRATAQAEARRAVRRLVALGAGALAILAAIVVLLILGVGHAHGDEPPAPDAKAARAAEAKPAKAADAKPAKAADAKPAKAADAKPAKAAAARPADERPAAKPADRLRKRTTVATARPAPEPAPAPDPMEAPPGPRAVRVRLLDGSMVVGTVHAEEAAALVVDCALGLLSIPRTRISTIAYDSAAGVGQKRAPVQQLDDDDDNAAPSAGRKHTPRP